MARPLENPEAIPNYLDFFGMTRPPFSRVSEPAQIFHAEQYSLLYDHLASATQESDCLVVICGADGSGKTTLLNRYIASLSPDAFFASFDEACTDGTQFHCRLLQQLGFNDISGTLNELRHISREFLIHRGLAGDHVLLVIDNAHLVTATVLEQLRWLSDIKAKEQRVISLVMSGNPDLSRIMASPAMSSIQFKQQVDFNIRVYTERETDDYLRHRMRLAGGAESAKWSTEARPLIHRFSGGIPSLINRLCNAVLTEAFAQETRVITEELIRSVAENHKFVPHVVPLHGKGRRQTDRPLLQTAIEPETEERISTRQAPRDASNDFPRPDAVNAEIARLEAQISDFVDEVSKANAEKEKAIRDIAARDSDINALLDKIATQTKDAEQLAKTAQLNADEIQQLNRSLSEGQEALTTSEQESAGLAAELKATRAQVRKFETALDKAKLKIEKLEGQKSDLKTEVSDLKAELKTGAADSRSRQKALDKTITDLEKSLARLQTECESLGVEAESAKDLRRALEQAQAESETLQESADQATEFQAALQAAQIECEELRVDAAKAREIGASLEALEKENESLRDAAADTKELKRSLREVRRESDALRSDAAAVKELEQSLEDVQTECDALRSKLAATATLEARLERSQAECDALKADAKALKELRKRLKKAQKESDSLRVGATAARELREALDKAEKESESLRIDAAVRQELEESHDKLQAECEALRVEAAAAKVLKETLAEVEKEAESLRDDAAARQELEKSHGRLQAECEALRLEAAAAKELQESLKEIQEESRTLRADAAAANELEKSLREIQKECELLRFDAAAMAELEKSLNDVRSECDSLREEIGRKRDLEKSLQDVTTERDSLRDEVQSKLELEQSLGAVQAECNALQAEVDAKRELERSLSEVQAECEALRSEATSVAEFEESLADREAKIASLQSDLETYARELTATQALLTAERAGSRTHAESDTSDSAKSTPPLSIIEVYKGGKIVQVFTTTPAQTRVMVGRSEDSDLRLQSRFVSRHHALIFLADDRAYIEDLRSYNGTIVNKKKTKRCDLGPADRITIGDFQLRLKPA